MAEERGGSAARGGLPRAQAFNVIWTLILAFLLFGGILFTAPALK